MLDFKPDIVWGCRDPWMTQHHFSNPYRQYYKLWWMACVDSEPQQKIWVDWFKKCDYITTYTEWAKSVLENDNVNVFSVTPPGTDTKIFKPADNKKELREKLGLNPDWFIIQTVMRNQGRKLYPDLFKAFAKFLEICKEQGNEKLAQKTFLHIHTSFVDVGFDLKHEIQKHSLGHKVLITYLDHKTKNYEISFYKGINAFTNITRERTAQTTNTAVGVTREQMAEIMSVADLYVQYSVAGAAEMPIMDAKACGVPIMATAYAGMAEQTINGGGIPLKVLYYVQESSIQETGQLRARPDHEYAAKKLYEFFNAKPDYREKLSKEARECSLRYDWDEIAKKFENLLDQVTIPSDDSNIWTSKPFIHTSLTEIPYIESNKVFIDWCYSNIVGRPWFNTLELSNKILTCLESGFETVIENGQQKNIPFGRKELAEKLLKYCHFLNQQEEIRYNLLVNNQTNKNIGYIKL